jgi:hypothetical protein
VLRKTPALTGRPKLSKLTLVAVRVTPLLRVNVNGCCVAGSVMIVLVLSVQR